VEDQVTVLFVVPVTTAENCSVAFVLIEVDVGLTVTVTLTAGTTTVTFADADTAVLATLVAVT